MSAVAVDLAAERAASLARQQERKRSEDDRVAVIDYAKVEVAAPVESKPPAIPEPEEKPVPTKIERDEEVTTYVRALVETDPEIAGTVTLSKVNEKFGVELSYQTFYRLYYRPIRDAVKRELKPAVVAKPKKPAAPAKPAPPKYAAVNSPAQTPPAPPKPLSQYPDNTKRQVLEALEADLAIVEVALRPLEHRATLLRLALSSIREFYGCP